MQDKSRLLAVCVFARNRKLYEQKNNTGKESKKSVENHMVQVYIRKYMAMCMCSSERKKKHCTTSFFSFSSLSGYNKIPFFFFSLLFYKFNRALKLHNKNIRQIDVENSMDDFRLYFSDFRNVKKTYLTYLYVRKSSTVHPK